MKKIKKFLRVVCAFGVLFSIMVVNAISTSQANSAQSRFYGADQTGLIIKDIDSPIVIEKEVLTLDLQEFPKNYYVGVNDFLTYTGKVTADYTFYNPSDYTITATLLFPFGNLPSYSEEYDEQTGKKIDNADADKYQILANGVAVNKKTRFSLASDSNFNLESDLPKLSDTYIDDDFYKSQTVVTKYTYIVGGANKEGVIDENKYKAATIAFDYDGGNGQTKVYFPSSSGFSTLKNGNGRFSKWAKNGDLVTVYAIGRALDKPFEFKCYENGACEDKKRIDGLVALVKTETLDFESFALEKWTEDLGVTKTDWYNAVVCAFRDGLKANEKFNFVYQDYGFSFSAQKFMKSFMRWYEYEIVFAPEARINNIVTAPIYPEINLNYQPSVCRYTYLLSSAKTWKSFGALDIIVNTPYYISDSSIDGFTKTQSGYKVSLNGLPSNELTFNLSTSENPTLKQTDYKKGCRLF